MAGRQVLYTDKIGTLSHSGGNITMAASLSTPSYLTIGGLQYDVTSNLVVALPTLTANSRYQVYAVQSAGVVSLVISTNENSVGPASQTSWKLIGSLYSNATPAFGVFVNIEGVPRFDDWMSYNTVISNLGGTFSVNYAYWRRNGSNIEFKGAWTMTGNGSGGSIVQLSLPISNLIDNGSPFGFFDFFDSSANNSVGTARLLYSSTSTIAFIVTREITAGSNRPMFGSDMFNGDVVNLLGSCTTSSFSNTPLKDL